ncbi:MAG: glycosyltransferase family 9 protein [Planctomycetes bacterium]|nr:glycosyltransferase family 9 protein [Planctomycetota bacterium]
MPALVSLKQAFPNARIDWVVEQGFEPIIEHHPALNLAIPFPKKAVKQALKRLNPGPFLEFLRTLRRGRYDAVFDLQGLARSGLMTWATGAANRYGLADARECAHLAYNHKAVADIELHTVERMLAVVSLAGVEPVRDMRLYSASQAAKQVANLGWTAERFAVLAPTSRWPGKQWPSDRFASLAVYLASRGIHVAVVGAASERGQCGGLIEVAKSQPKVHDLIGTTPLDHLLALIERASLVVANDSAALHIAVGFNRPLVALFGPTRVHRVGPYRRESDVLQIIRKDDVLDHKNDRSGMELMRRLTTQSVIEACDQRLHMHV